MTDDVKNGAPLWSGLESIVPLNARIVGSTALVVRGVSIDTRTLQPGDLFFAIRGDANDGHAFVEQAFAKGAAAAVVDEAHADALKKFGTLYVVHDVLRAMEDLGRAARRRMTGVVCAITGSVGKTSTKEMLKGVLSAAGKTHASVASYNNHWGVPLTLSRMPADASFAIFEIGMNHSNEIRPLTKMVNPHVALITAIAPVHLENLGTIEAIADAKAEIFEGLEAGGVAIIPRDTPHYVRLDTSARGAGADTILSFGETAGADAQLISFEPQAEGSLVSAEVMGEQLTYRLGAPGRHLAQNSLAILLCARAVGVDMVEAAHQLQFATAPQGRGQQITLEIDGASATLIDESYNANPVSMRAALTLLSQTPMPAIFGRRMAMLGDMLELGPDEIKLHADLADVIAGLPVDLVHTVGPRMKALHEALPAGKAGLHADKVTDILETLVDQVVAGDVVMIKGSNGIRMGSVVQALKDRHAPQQNKGEG